MLSNANSAIVNVCAQTVDGYSLTSAEKKLINAHKHIVPDCERKLLGRLDCDNDALGQSYMDANEPAILRPRGETYTPQPIIDFMLKSIESIREPQRIVDVGCGSGRFALSAAQRFPQAKIIAIDSSPMATLMCKANASLLGVQSQVQIINKSILSTHIPTLQNASTCWIGNPPYVRHHFLKKKQKQWLAKEANKLGYKASGLTGLHVYFFLAIARQYGPHDFGRLITSAEWLEVNYGQLGRSLMLNNLGLSDLTIYDRRQNLFDKVDTTSVIVGFDAHNISNPAKIVIRDSEKCLARKTLSAKRLARLPRWTPGLLFGEKPDVPEGYIRLGEIARVHRGIVTGANKFWVRRPEEVGDLGVPVVSHAKEILGLGGSIDDPSALSALIALPEDLSSLSKEQKARAIRIIEEGKKLGIDKSYTAKSRKHWWSIPLRGAAPILMTYMGRKSPTFVSNPKECRNLNVIHGIYPKTKMSQSAISALVDYLNANANYEEGRTYSGGLMKFEPKEAESLIIPSLKELESRA